MLPISIGIFSAIFKTRWFYRLFYFSTGITPKAFEQKRASSNGCFFYGGTTYTTMK